MEVKGQRPYGRRTYSKSPIPYLGILFPSADLNPSSLNPKPCRHYEGKPFGHTLIPEP